MFIKDTQNKEYDLVIIGAGAAGITIAKKMAEEGKVKTLLLETGGFEFSETAWNLSNVEAEGHFDASHFRNHSQRIFGGTTSVWSNMSSMLEERSFINKEWPIGFDEILPFYDEAHDMIQLRDGAVDHVYAKFTERDVIQYRPYYKSYKRSTRFGEEFRDILSNSKNVDVLLNSTCIKVHQDNNQISNLTIRPTFQDKPDFTVKGKHYVVACGGIGNPRLLLQSSVASNLPVGNYLMEHPHYIDAGHIEVNIETLDPVIYTSKTIHAFALSDQYCIDNNVLNASISFKDHVSENRPLLGHKQECFTSIASMRTEMPALKENKVALTDELDNWGLPKVKVTLNFGYTDQAKDLWKVFAKELLVANAGRLTEFSHEKLYIIGGGHLMGSTRMGNNMKSSVVDGNCKVHGINNLYIAGSSIFSASAAANPTYSIVAFSLRLSEHLQTQVFKS